MFRSSCYTIIVITANLTIFVSFTVKETKTVQPALDMKVRMFREFKIPNRTNKSRPTTSQCYSICTTSHGLTDTLKNFATFHLYLFSVFLDKYGQTHFCTASNETLTFSKRCNEFRISFIHVLCGTTE